jgi:hypothetical protein
MSILSFEGTYEICNSENILILIKKKLSLVNVFTSHLMLLNLTDMMFLNNPQFESVNCNTLLCMFLNNPQFESVNTNTLLCAGMFVSCSWNMRLMWTMQTVGAEHHYGQHHPWDTQALLSCCSSGDVMWIASIQRGVQY